MAPAERKPVGGIRSVTLRMLEHNTFAELTPVENRSDYTEEVLSDDGVLRVHHTLTLTLARTDAMTLAPRLPGLISHGAAAYVTTETGEELIAGWSNRFVLEQPLRLTSFRLGSGTRPADGNEAILRFESDDTTLSEENLPE